MALSDLTTNSLTGTGVFDVLMSTCSKHLEQEFERNRITGKDYATVYLGSLTAVLQQAIQYLSIDNVKAKIDAETQLILAGIPKIAKEIDVMNSTIAKQEKEIELLNAQLPKILKEIELMTKEIELKNAELPKIAKEIELMSAQLPKITAEIALLNQKTSTEAAQLSVLDKQKALYEAQTAGFERDAEQKLAKIMVDSWSVRRTTDDGTLTPTTLADPSIDTVISKVAQGIGVTL